MPWKETRVMDVRLELIQLVEEGESVASAARIQGVARKTADKWVSRFEAEGVAGLADRSRAPHSRPAAFDEETIARVVALRASYPTWGPRKLMHWLRVHEPELPCPAASTIGQLLKERGLTAPGRRKRPLKPYTQPLAHCTAPNSVWCADFKGWFRTRDGQRCDPLTISDGHSRFLLRVQALAQPTLAAVLPLFNATLREYGLPDAIRTDNGPPFASTTGIGLSRLAVGWIDLGITPERIRPGKPQENGRHERMHRTLKADTLKPPAGTRRKQQHRFDLFQEQYNHERPHQALNYQTPAQVHTSSERPYPDRVAPPQYDTGSTVCRVYDKGSFYYNGHHYFLTSALGAKRIALLPINEADGILAIYYRHVPVASLNLHERKIGPAPKAQSNRTATPSSGGGSS